MRREGIMDYQKLLDRSEPWLEYAIRLNVFRESRDTLVELRNTALADSRMQKYLYDVSHFHDVPVTNHKNPDLPVHKLLFLLDLGFDMDVPEIKTAVEQILRHRDDCGVFQSLTNIPKHFGGTGADVFSWCLCDAPLLLLVLLKAGVDYREYIEPAMQFLTKLARDNGFPCAASPELGNFRGPGKKDDCCPYATLIMADVMSYIPEYRDSPAAVSSVSALLNLWKNSLVQHPYMFYLGTDFRKLKAPSMWFDIVSTAGVLSKYEYAGRDDRFREMTALIREKQDPEGFFTPESVYLKMKDWDFGQKKKPSPYLTYLCMRIFDRMDRG